jgi:hypothetical protein
MTARPTRQVRRVRPDLPRRAEHRPEPRTHPHPHPGTDPPGEDPAPRPGDAAGAEHVRPRPRLPRQCQAAHPPDPDVRTGPVQGDRHIRGRYQASRPPGPAHPAPAGGGHAQEPGEPGHLREPAGTAGPGDGTATRTARRTGPNATAKARGGARHRPHTRRSAAPNHGRTRVPIPRRRPCLRGCRGRRTRPAATAAPPPVPSSAPTRSGCPHRACPGRPEPVPGLPAARAGPAPRPSGGGHAQVPGEPGHLGEPAGTAGPGDGTATRTARRTGPDPVAKARGRARHRPHRPAIRIPRASTFRELPAAGPRSHPGNETPAKGRRADVDT